MFDFKQKLIDNFRYHLSRNFSFWRTEKNSDKQTLIYLRNRAIEATIRDYARTIPKELYSGVRHSTIKDQYRAQHYGKDIGDIAYSTPIPTNDHASQLAKLKRKVWNISKQINMNEEYIRHCSQCIVK